MVSITCVDCGNCFDRFSKGSRRSVKACPSCTRLFSDDDMDNFLDNFFSKPLL